MRVFMFWLIIIKMNELFNLEYLQSQLERGTFTTKEKLVLIKLLDVVSQPYIELAKLRSLCKVGIPHGLVGKF